VTCSLCIFITIKLLCRPNPPVESQLIGPRLSGDCSTPSQSKLRKQGRESTGVLCNSGKIYTSHTHETNLAYSHLLSYICRLENLQQEKWNTPQLESILWARTPDRVLVAPCRWNHHLVWMIAFAVVALVRKRTSGCRSRHPTKRHVRSSLI
jgi:hypothetical protein